MIKQQSGFLLWLPTHCPLSLPIQNQRDSNLKPLPKIVYCIVMWLKYLINYLTFTYIARNTEGPERRIICCYTMCVKVGKWSNMGLIKTWQNPWMLTNNASNQMWIFQIICGCLRGWHVSPRWPLPQAFSKASASAYSCAAAVVCRQAYVRQKLTSKCWLHSSVLLTRERGRR